MRDLVEKKTSAPTAPGVEKAHLDCQPASDDLSHADLRRLHQSDALRVAEALQSADSLGERIDIYRSNQRRLLAIAASLWPELMPTLNGELEWIALSTADIDVKAN